MNAFHKLLMIFHEKPRPVVVIFGGDAADA